LSESTFAWVYSVQFLLKSTHHARRYERKCERAFFFWTQCILSATHRRRCVAPLHGPEIRHLL